MLDVKNGIIKKAFDFSQKAHQGQKRKNGEPYFNHCLAAAEKVQEWKIDDATVAAALLHDTAEDAGISLDELRSTFGEEIAFLVESVSKVGKIKYRGIETQAENLRKLILALSEDLRAVFIKLADRLHNMQTLDALPENKQQRIALETLEVYAPLAYRLGMENISGELEDLAFPYLYPQEYQWIKNLFEKKYQNGSQYLKKVKPKVEKLLKSSHIIPLKIDYRVKKLYSLYRKLLNHDKDIERIHDLIALRIILKDVPDCYAALGHIHQIWPPLPGRIKDYIALPKPNGYQSLHTTVFCLDKRITEIQIRTKEMHEIAENGIAAHWAYAHKKHSEIADRKELRWVQQLRNWQKEFKEPEEFIQSLKIDFFKDRIFAITPKGEVIDLPAGSTPVDFAYHIHGEIGDQCSGAKVNGKIIPLNHSLQSGDVVEILTQKGKKPSRQWLEFVKTADAKHKIRSSLNKNLKSKFI